MAQQLTSRWRSTVALAVAMALVAAVAAFGGQFRPGAWYAALAKPAWTPPGWLFPPVWTALYVMIAVAGWLIWRAPAGGAAPAFWIAGLILNATWSWLFFGRHDIGLALADILLLWLTIAGFIVSAWPVDRRASLLFLPYLAWVGFASALNFAIWSLNR